MSFEIDFPVDPTLSKPNQKWLSAWFSRGEECSFPPEDIVKELSLYRPSKAVTLSRAEVTPSLSFSMSSPHTYTQISSWTHSQLVAESFVHHKEPVLTCTFEPSSILVDTTLLHSEFMNYFFPDELEVLILPGTYSISVEKN